MLTPASRTRPWALIRLSGQARFPTRTTRASGAIPCGGISPLKNIGRVRLLSRNLAGVMFPEDLQIQVSDDNATWTTIHTAVGLGPDDAKWHSFDVAGAGQYVRIYITKTRQYGGLFYAQIAEIELYEAGPVDSLLVTWTAPGDDVRKRMLAPARVGLG